MARVTGIITFIVGLVCGGGVIFIISIIVGGDTPNREEASGVFIVTIFLAIFSFSTIHYTIRTGFGRLTNNLGSLDYQNARLKKEIEKAELEKRLRELK